MSRIAVCEGRPLPSEIESGRPLFVRWGAEEVEFWTAAQKMRLNRMFYAQHMAAISARLLADAADYIAALEIA